MSESALRASAGARSQAAATADSPVGIARRPDRAALVVAMAAVLSAALAVTLSLTVFRRLSVNGDEAVYLLQARALAHGHLFPPVTQPADSFTPWLGRDHGGHYVLKYTPVVAGFFAVSLLVTGGYVGRARGYSPRPSSGRRSCSPRRSPAAGRSAATSAVLLAASPVVSCRVRSSCRTSFSSCLPSWRCGRSSPAAGAAAHPARVGGVARRDRLSLPGRSMRF